MLGWTAAAPSAERHSHPIGSIHAFQSELKRHEALTKRRGHCFSLLLFDINKGPSPVRLRRLEQAVLQRARSTDAVGRCADNRLGVILPYCPSSAALRLARDVRDAEPALRAVAYSVQDCSYIKRFNTHQGTAPSQTAGGAGARWGKVSGDTPQRYRRAAERWRSGRSPRDAHQATQNAERRALHEAPARCPLPLWKRTIDVVGAALGLVLLSPLFLVVGIFIKSISKGPVFFRQERVGHMGTTFRMWKFRTYEHHAGGAQHEQYVKSLIHSARQSEDTAQPSMQKLDNAPDIIPFGNMLRKTCIDELPQLINVLVGDMSLIGPRPPINYEVRQYANWHKRRLCAVPGMTGLWQVNGKNRLTFNEMVRLDIRYSRALSPWLDLGILLKTPLTIASQVRDSFRGKSPCPAQELIRSS